MSLPEGVCGYMKKISVLDCTLRDGGYVNDFKFGKANIKAIIGELAKASIDIIECGFLRSGSKDSDRTIFPSVSEIREYIGEKNDNSMYVAMIQYGTFDTNDLEINNGKSIDGIRLTFHEHEIAGSLRFAEHLMDKGYKVFIQPVGTTSYDDDVLIALIKDINRLRPYAFYMVDTLGKMYKNDLLHLFYLVDHNLDDRIALGFHSHNNLQMSFANAQELTQINSKRNLIIDASVLGMGRGAGNLNTELLVQYLNVNQGLKYDVFKIMNIMDQYIKPLSAIYKWGYDAVYYLAAVTECHPNYASFLLNTQTLQVKDIGTILNGLSTEKKTLFDKEYIQSEYMKYMDHSVDDSDTREKLMRIIDGKKVLLLAPGKSLRNNTNRILELVDSLKCIVVSINFIPTDIPVDMAFVSNMKRFKNTKEMMADEKVKIVLTSNIATSCEGCMIVNYASYLNEDINIIDNAGMMCINLLTQIGIKHIILAGFDGFTGDIKEDFYEESLYVDVEQERLAKMNIAMSNKIKLLKKQINIEFFASSIYDK